jgi:hypothetical protein
MKYTWLQAKADITTPLVDITATARLMALLLERRPNNMLAKLWIAGRAAHRAMLEAKTNPHPITLPETTYLTLTLGQMSDQELRDFDLPGIGDNLDETNLSGAPMWTMTALKKAVEACTKPPKYRAVSTPVTKLLDQYSSSAPPAKDPKPPKDSNRRNPRPTDRSNYPLNKDKGKKEPKPAHRNRVDHENFAKFPKGMRRPDPSQTVGGKKISNETQQKLYDDIKHNRCTRCHLSGHFRANCSKPVKAFEKAFDTQKVKYWQGLCHWQQKASDDTTLESNATVLCYPATEGEEAALRCNFHLIDTPESGSESDSATGSESSGSSSLPELHSISNDSSTSSDPETILGEELTTVKVTTESRDANRRLCSAICLESFERLRLGGIAYYEQFDTIEAYDYFPVNQRQPSPDYRDPPPPGKANLEVIRPEDRKQSTHKALTKDTKPTSPERGVVDKCGLQPASECQPVGGVGKNEEGGVIATMTPSEPNRPRTLPNTEVDITVASNHQSSGLNNAFPAPPPVSLALYHQTIGTDPNPLAMESSTEPPPDDSDSSSSEHSQDQRATPSAPTHMPSNWSESSSSAPVPPTLEPRFDPAFPQRGNNHRVPQPPHRDPPFGPDQPPPTWGKPDRRPPIPDLDAWGIRRPEPRGAHDANRPHHHVSPGWEGFHTGLLPASTCITCYADFTPPDLHERECSQCTLRKLCAPPPPSSRPTLARWCRTCCTDFTPVDPHERECPPCTLRKLCNPPLPSSPEPPPFEPIFECITCYADFCNPDPHERQCHQCVEESGPSTSQRQLPPGLDESSSSTEPPPRPARLHARD